MTKRQWEWKKARIIYLPLALLEMLLTWYAASLPLPHLIGEICLFLPFLLGIAILCIIEAKAGTQALKAAQNQQSSLPPQERRSPFV